MKNMLKVTSALNVSFIETFYSIGVALFAKTFLA